MANTAILAIRIVGDASSGVRALDQTSAKSSKLAGVMGTVAKAGALAFAAAGVAAVKFGSDAIGAASDLNETLSKSKIIFGDNAKAMQKWAAGAATSAGLSKQAALEAAAGFGDMFSQIGFTQDAAAKMSKSTVQLSADLGSFNNLPTEDVSQRIAAAFRGEYDSLQALIPNINAARVESKALAMTGKDNAKQLTAQEKAAAVLAIVHKDGARAAGDFARTSDGLANQQKILAANFENVKAKIGKALLPVAAGFVKFLNDQMGPALKDLWGLIKANVIPVLADLGEFFKTNVIPAAREVWSFFKTKVLPVLLDMAGFVRDKVIPAVRELAEKALRGLRGFIDNVSKSLKDNRPFLEQLREGFKNVAEFIFTKVYPAMGVIAEKALPILGKAIGVAITVLKNLSVAFLKLAEFAVKSFRFLLNAALSTFEGIIKAAAAGLGWIPGIGDKIKGASKAFSQFKDDTIAALDQTAAKLKSIREAIEAIPKTKSVVIDVSLAGNGLKPGQLPGVTRTATPLAGGDTFHFTISGFVGDEDALVSKLTRAMDRRARLIGAS